MTNDLRDTPERCHRKQREFEGKGENENEARQKHITHVHEFTLTLSTHWVLSKNCPLSTCLSLQKLSEFTFRLSIDRFRIMRLER